MPRFMIERNFAEQLELTSEGAQCVRQINDEKGVKWLFSFLSADKKKTYCLYEAPNVDAILAAARRGAACEPACRCDRRSQRPAPGDVQLALECGAVYAHRTASGRVTGRCNLGPVADITLAKRQRTGAVRSASEGTHSSARGEMGLVQPRLAVLFDLPSLW
jgi:Protein of unknown function (DUF4242)